MRSGIWSQYEPIYSYQIQASGCIAIPGDYMNIPLHMRLPKIWFSIFTTTKQTNISIVRRYVSQRYVDLGVSLWYVCDTRASGCDTFQNAWGRIEPDETRYAYRERYACDMACDTSKLGFEYVNLPSNMYFRIIQHGPDFCGSGGNNTISAKNREGRRCMRYARNVHIAILGWHCVFGSVSQISGGIFCFWFAENGCIADVSGWYAPQR